MLYNQSLRYNYTGTADVTELEIETGDIAEVALTAKELTNLNQHMILVRCIFELRIFLLRCMVFI